MTSAPERRSTRHRKSGRVEFNFAFEDYGWAVLQIQDPRAAQVHRFIFSHTTDGIGQLVESVANLCQGQGDEFAIVWDQEPETVRVVVARTDLKDSFATITFSAGETDKARTAKVTSVVRVRLPIEALGAAIRRAVDEIDPAQYAENWPLHPFPHAARRSLDSDARS